jgi:hypothetical protein
MSLVLTDSPAAQRERREFLDRVFAHQRFRPTNPYRRGRLQERRRGALVVPDVGEVVLLSRVLYATPGDLTLKLFKNDVTPGESDTHATYTVADFTNYVDKTLTASQTGGTWAAPSTNTGTTSAAYAQQTWTCGATGNTVYGYWVQTATPVCTWAERFATPRVLADTDVLNLTPRVELA